MDNNFKYVYKIRLDLYDTKPPIWRRILVPSNFTLWQLHCVIQISMGWADCHMHEFEICNERYGNAKNEFLEKCDLPLDEKKFTLEKLKLKKGDRINYVYDFGDYWQHKLKIEDVIKKSDCKEQVPSCIKLVRNCPLEDCGGIGGYEEILEILSDKNHTEYKEISNLYAEDISEQHLFSDIKEINERLISPEEYEEIKR